MVSMSAIRSLRNCMFSVSETDCRLTWKGMELWAIGSPRGRVMLCTRAMPSTRNRFLAILSRDDHVSGVTQVMARLHQQDIGIHPGRAEMALGGSVTDIRRQFGRNVVPVVITGLVSGKDEKADERDSDRGCQYRRGPTHHGCAGASPSAALDLFPWIKLPESDWLRPELRAPASGSPPRRSPKRSRWGCPSS